MLHPKWNESRKQWILHVCENGTHKQFTSKIPRSEGRQAVIAKAEAYLLNKETPDQTFGDVFGLFLSAYKDRHGDTASLKEYKSFYETRLFVLSDVPMRDIKIDSYQNIISNAKPLIRTGARGKEFSKTDTLSKKYLTHLKSCCISFHRWAAAHDYCRALDLSRELYVPADAPVHERTILTKEDYKKLLSYESDLFYLPHIKILAGTGMRPSELIGLRFEDYDEESHSFFIRRSVTRDGIREGGKTKNAARVVPVLSSLIPTVESMIEKAKSLHSTGWIFCNPSGTMCNQVVLRRGLVRIEKEAGISTDVTLYSLRHSFYTHVESEMPPRLLKLIFGHSDSMPRGVYGDHLISDDITRARLNLEAVFNDQN